MGEPLRTSRSATGFAAIQDQCAYRGESIIGRFQSGNKNSTAHRRIVSGRQVLCRVLPYSTPPPHAVLFAKLFTYQQLIAGQPLSQATAKAALCRITREVPWKTTEVDNTNHNLAGVYAELAVTNCVWNGAYENASVQSPWAARSTPNVTKPRLKNFAVAASRLPNRHRPLLSAQCWVAGHCWLGSVWRLAGAWHSATKRDRVASGGKPAVALSTYASE